MSPFVKTLLASCALVLATSAMAASDASLRKQEYNDAINAANSDYDNAIAACKSLSGGERRDCRNNAKNTRRDAVQAAREQRYSTSYNTAPGAANPAERSVEAKP